MIIGLLSPKIDTLSNLTTLTSSPPLAETQEHRLALSDIQPDNQGKWRTQLNQWECALFEHVAPECLSKHSYAFTETQGGSCLHPYFLTLPVLAEPIAARFTINWVKRGVKNALPLVLWPLSWLRLTPAWVQLLLCTISSMNIFRFVGSQQPPVGGASCES